MGVVSLRIDADSAKAVAEYMKLTQAEQAAILEAKRLGLETRKAGSEGMQAFQGMLGPLKGIAGALGFSFGVGAILHQLVGELQNWKRYLGEISVEQRKAGQELGALALPSPPAAARGSRPGRRVGCRRRPRPASRASDRARAQALRPPGPPRWPLTAHGKIGNSLTRRRGRSRIQHSALWNCGTKMRLLGA